MRAALLCLVLAGCVLPEQDLASETDICFACAQTSCGAEIGACSADEDCASLLSCVQGCTSDDCTGACVSDHPNGVMLATPVLDCATASCPEDCDALAF